MSFFTHKNGIVLEGGTTPCTSSHLINSMMEGGSIYFDKVGDNIVYLPYSHTERMDSIPWGRVVRVAKDEIKVAPLETISAAVSESVIGNAVVEPVVSPLIQTAVLTKVKGVDNVSIINNKGYKIIKKESDAVYLVKEKNGKMIFTLKISNNDREEKLNEIINLNVVETFSESTNVYTVYSYDYRFKLTNLLKNKLTPQDITRVINTVTTFHSTGHVHFNLTTDDIIYDPPNGVNRTYSIVNLDTTQKSNLFIFDWYCLYISIGDQNKELKEACLNKLLEYNQNVVLTNEDKENISKNTTIFSKDFIDFMNNLNNDPNAFLQAMGYSAANFKINYSASSVNENLTVMKNATKYYLDFFNIDEKSNDLYNAYNHLINLDPSIDEYFKIYKAKNKYFVLKKIPEQLIQLVTESMIIDILTKMVNMFENNDFILSNPTQFDFIIKRNAAILVNYSSIKSLIGQNSNTKTASFIISLCALYLNLNSGGQIAEKINNHIILAINEHIARLTNETINKGEVHKLFPIQGLLIMIQNSTNMSDDLKKKFNDIINLKNLTSIISGDITEKFTKLLNSVKKYKEISRLETDFIKSNEANKQLYYNRLLNYKQVINNLNVINNTVLHNDTYRTFRNALHNNNSYISAIISELFKAKYAPTDEICAKLDKTCDKDNKVANLCNDSYTKTIGTIILDNTYINETIRNLDKLNADIRALNDTLISYKNTLLEQLTDKDKQIYKNASCKELENVINKVVVITENNEAEIIEKIKLIKQEIETLNRQQVINFKTPLENRTIEDLNTLLHQLTNMLGNLKKSE